MVNTGRPSQACQNCRSRRIRCDQRTPECSQCIKSRYPCPGYRNQLDLMFRDERELVIRKAHGRVSSRSPKATSPSVSAEAPAAGKIKSSSPTAESFDSAQSLGNFDIQEDFSWSLLESITPPMSEYATGFFFSRYILSDGQKLRGYFEYLPQYYSQTDIIDPLRSCMTAVGLAGLSNINQSEQLMSEATREYAVALRSTNAALRSSDEATKDKTVIAVMLLGLFETTTFSGRRSVKAWSDHLNGATMLIKLRGRQQFQTQAGIRIFQQLMSTILFSCLQQTVPVPRDILDLRHYATNFFDANVPNWLVSNLAIRYIDLLVAIKDGSIFSPESIISCALQIDSDLRSVSTNVPADWEYESIITNAAAEPQLVYEGYYHVYVDRWTIQAWNTLRTLRILLNGIIRDQIISGSPSTRPLCRLPEYALQQQTSADIITQMSSEICASLPQYAGYLSSLPNPDSCSPRNGIQDRDAKQDLDRGYGSHYFILPFWAVGMLPTSPVRLRLWIIDRLQQLGRTAGTRQAMACAEMMKQCLTSREQTARLLGYPMGDIFT